MRIAGALEAMKNEDNKSNTVPSNDCVLTALALGNFKAFAETQRLPIRPLTLIFGANSSGKSSLIHSLLLARHAMETGELDIHRTAIGGESVDLGGFRQYVHRREAARRFEWAGEIDVSQLQGRL